MMDSIMTKERPTPPLAGLGPAWFEARREEARAAFRDLAWPGAKEARWRNSPIEAFQAMPAAGTMALPEPPAPYRVKTRIKKGASVALHLRIIDGSLVEGLSGPPTAKGISLGLGVAGLRERQSAAMEPGDLDDKFQARLWAEANPLLTITLAEDCVLDAPIVVEWESSGRKGYEAPVIFLNLGAGARARLDLLWSTGKGAAVSPALRVELGSGAGLGIFELIDLAKGSLFLDYPKAHLGPGADLDWTRGFLGSGIATSRLGVDLGGRASRFNLSTSYAVGAGAHLETAVVQHHIGEATWSRSRFEGVVDGDGRAVCRGLIKVEHSAMGTDAYLSSRALALSPEAKTVSLPELSIDTNELSASHGSTVGSVSPEDLFYLGTRGLSPSQAKALIGAGLLGGLLERAPPELAGHVEARIEEVLGEDHA